MTTSKLTVAATFAGLVLAGAMAHAGAEVALWRQAPPQDQVVAAPDSWWRTNEGTLLGSALAGIVAVAAVLLTHWLDKRRHRNRMRKVYAGILHSIHVELVWHKGVIRRIREHIEELTRVASETGTLPVPDVGDRFETEYLEQCRLRILEHDNFDTALMRYLAEYTNFLRFVNRATDFRSAQEAIAHFDDEQDRKQGLVDYFGNLLDELTKLEAARPVIQERIRREVGKVPGVEVTEVRGGETLANQR